MSEPHYDAALGQVLSVDQYINSTVHVRAGLLDAEVLKAVIAELGRLGYTVIPPETREDSAR